MSDLINNLYLPDFTKRQVRDGEAYKLLEKNKLDTSSLEGYETTEKVEPIEFPVFNSQSDKDKFVDENATSTATGAKDYLETFGNILTNETEDFLTSMQLAAVNGADVAVNLMPLAYKMFESAPIAMALPKEFFNKETEGDVMRVAQHYSDNLEEYRQHLFDKQKDNGWVKDILSLVVQDSAYSIPAFNWMRKSGIPKYPAFFLSAAIGAVGVENVDKDGDKTYFAPFSKDVQELKNLLNILPDTPADMIADEVHQALEYGTFGAIIPGVIDAFKFMKQYLPKFQTVAGSTAAVAALSADNEAEGFIKPILKAVDNVPMFKSAVVDAADKIPAVASGEQIFKTISNTQGVKQSELKWMDLEGFLKNKNKVSKEEVLEYINANKIDVTEVKLNASDRAIKTDDALESLTNDFELKWLKSQYADEATYAAKDYEHAMLLDNNLNYDVYKVGIDDARYLPDDQQIDWQSMNRNPVILALDDMFDFQGGMVEMVSDGSIFNYRNMLNHKGYKEWIDVNGDIRGYVVDLNKNVSKIKDINSIVGANLKPIAGTENRVVVNGRQLKELETIDLLNSEVLTSYKIPEIEFEKYLVEGQSRQFKLQNTDLMPIYEKYTSAGGTNYTELVFKIKNKEGTTPAILEGEFGTLAGNKMKSSSKTSINYTSSHFNKMNEFAHVRFKTRTLPNGKKVLTVEEMQSDLLQASKTDLFSSAQSSARAADEMRYANTDKVLKDFPFKNNWYEFTIKRLTRYAADNGFDAIAIPKGELAANRYSKDILKIKSIDVEPMAINKMEGEVDMDGVVNSKGFFIRLNDEAGEKVFERTIYGVPGDDDFFSNFKDLSKDVGESNLAEIQQLILQADETDQVAKKLFEKTQIEGAGKGKYNLYNQTIPGYMKKYAKKWNAKVYDDSFLIKPIIGQNTDMPVTVLELSDEMKTGVQSSSQPLFELFGTVGLSYWGAQAVSDSMENNSISQTTN